MRKRIELADTTFRAYHTKDGSIVLHLTSYLTLRADAAIRSKLETSRRNLSTIMSGNEKPEGLCVLLSRFPRCWIQLPGRKRTECDVSYSAWPASRPTRKSCPVMESVDDNGHMLFHFWAKASIRDKQLDDCIAEFRLELWFDYPGSGPRKQVIQRKAPVVTRFLYNKSTLTHGRKTH